MMNENPEFRVDMDTIVGVGGEGIVLRDKMLVHGKIIDCAVKFTLYKDKWRILCEQQRGDIWSEHVYWHLAEFDEYVTARV